jgi:formylglycine-generating enzyme required for sulfatase activity
MLDKYRRIMVVSIVSVGAFLSLTFRDLEISAAEASASQIAPGTIMKDARGVEMVFVPGGSFELGITPDDLTKFCLVVLKDGDENHCKQMVNIIGEETGILDSQVIELPPFWIDRYEVTIEQYQRCTLSGSGALCPKIDLSSQPKLADNPQKPQLGVNWYSALYFCNSRGARLPTEKEWEYAASGTHNLYFPWGDAFVEAYVSPVGTTYPVGTAPGNKSWIGAYDMSGNAAEWVEDRLLPYSSPKNWPQDFRVEDVSRVLRGGSWVNRRFHFATFYREARNPNSQDQSAGFRCARSNQPTQ